MSNFTFTDRKAVQRRHFVRLESEIRDLGAFYQKFPAEGSGSGFNLSDGWTM